MPDRIPLILIPGFLSTPALWANQTAALSPLADIRITEQSRCHDSVEKMVPAILEEAPARFALCGHSFGGFVALAVALQAPERVCGLAIINSTADLTLPPDQERKRRGLKRLAGTGDLKSIIAWAQKSFLGGDDPTGGAFEQTIEEMVRSVGTTGFSRQLDASMTAARLTDRLNEIGCPTLVVCSTGDTLLPCARARDIASGIQHSTLIEIDGKTHLTPLENPDRLNDALVKWLDAVPR